MLLGPGNPALVGYESSVVKYRRGAKESGERQQVQKTAGDFCRGPGANKWDTAAAQALPVVQLRAEFFNTWNHTEWSGVNAGCRPR
jgi:hypothetical protein